MLIVSPRPFNDATRLPVILPITTGGAFARRLGFAVSLDGAGITTKGIIRCDQPRIIDIEARRGRKVDALPPDLMDEALAKLATIFE